MGESCDADLRRSIPAEASIGPSFSSSSEEEEEEEELKISSSCESYDDDRADSWAGPDCGVVIIVLPVPSSFIFLLLLLLLRLAVGVGSDVGCGSWAVEWDGSNGTACCWSGSAAFLDGKATAALTSPTLFMTPTASSIIYHVYTRYLTVYGYIYILYSWNKYITDTCTDAMVGGCVCGSSVENYYEYW